jgi:hypothetical protein
VTIQRWKSSPLPQRGQRPRIPRTSTVPRGGRFDVIGITERGAVPQYSSRRGAHEIAGPSSSPRSPRSGRARAEQHQSRARRLIGLAQALDSSDREVADGSIFLAGRKDSFDRIYRIDILGSDGQPIDSPSRSTSTRGDDAIMTIVPASAPPANATLQLYVITQKARVSAPFELTVELP